MTLGMATLPASTRPTSVNPSFRHLTSSVTVELPERLSVVAVCREELILFTRRRMLDWKSQVTKLVAIAIGSVLVFVAWKSLVTWLA